MKNYPMDVRDRLQRMAEILQDAERRQKPLRTVLGDVFPQTRLGYGTGWLEQQPRQTPPTAPRQPVETRERCYLSPTGGRPGSADRYVAGWAAFEFWLSEHRRIIAENVSWQIIGIVTVAESVSRKLNWARAQGSDRIAAVTTSIGSLKSLVCRKAAERFSNSRVFCPAYHELRAEWMTSLAGEPSKFGRWRLRLAFRGRVTLLALDCLRCATWARLTSLPRRSA